MRNIFQQFFSKFSGQENPAIPSNSKAHTKNTRPFVKYQFNIPGVRNFHLLPFRSKRQGSLNIFKPHWSRAQSKIMR